MILYVKAKTDIPDAVIDYIDVKLNNDKSICLTWDESDYHRFENGFESRHKGMYFNKEYANGRIHDLEPMIITDICVYTTADTDSKNFVIEEMEFCDADESLMFIPPRLSEDFTILWSGSPDD